MKRRSPCSFCRWSEREKERERGGKGRAYEGWVRSGGDGIKSEAMEIERGWWDAKGHDPTRLQTVVPL